MGDINKFPKEKLICGIMTTDKTDFENVKIKLIKKFGPIDFISDNCDFDFTSYYEKEMGSDIKKRLISFKKLIDPDKLSNIKISTNKIENRFLDGQKRTVNLDPGILNESRLILASSKNRGHRVPMSKGIYGEITLLYINREFQPLRWTYVDYQTDFFKSNLLVIRKNYLQQRKLFLKK